MTRTAQTLTSTEAKALANIARYSVPPAAELAPASYSAGDLVVIHSRGTYRLAVVEKVGPKRLSVVYTTEGAIDTANKVHSLYVHRTLSPASIAARVTANYRHLESMADGTSDHYTRFFSAPIIRMDGTVAVSLEEQAERKAARMAENRIELDALEAQGGLEALIERTVSRMAADLEAEKAKPWEARVQFTRKSVPYAEVFAAPPA